MLIKTRLSLSFVLFFILFLGFSELNHVFPISISLDSNLNIKTHKIEQQRSETEFLSNSTLYYYRLKGVSDEWRSPISSNGLKFENLFPGNYTLEIKSIDSNSTLPFSIAFEVETKLYSKPGFLLLVLVVIIIILLYLSRIVSKIHFTHKKSFTTHFIIIRRMRVIGIVAIILLPLINYYESEIKELYEADWSLVLGIIAVATICFALSFWKNLSTNLAKNIVYFELYCLYFSYIKICYDGNFDIVLIIRLGIVLLFTKAIFIDQKAFFNFFIVSLLTILFTSLVLIEDSSVQELFIFIQLKSWFLILAIILIERSHVSSLSFASKILQNIKLFIVVMNKKGNIVYANDYVKEKFNVTETEILGDGWWKLRNLKKDAIKNCVNKALNVLKSGHSQTYVNELKINNKSIDVEWNDFALEEDYVIGIGKDVTDENQYKNKVELLSQVALNVTNGVVIVDEIGKVYWCNGAFSKLIGRPLENLIGNNPFNNIKLINTNSNQNYEVIKSTKLKETISLKFINNQGVEFSCLTTISPIYDGNPKKGKVMIFTDLSQQVRLESRFKDVVNNAFDAIYTINYYGEFTFINDAMVNHLGYSSSELKGKSFKSLICPEHKEEIIEFYRKQMHLKLLKSYKEFKIIKKNGDIIWIGQNVRLILDPAKPGRILELHAVARDIDEKKKHRDQLQQLSMVAMRTNSLVMITNQDGVVKWVNESFTKVLGYRKKEITNKFIKSSLNGLLEVTIFKNLCRESSKNDEAFHNEIKIFDKYGNEKWLELSIDRIYDSNGELINLIAVGSDVTERKHHQDIIFRQHKDMLDSMNYSFRIKQATVPSLDRLKEIRDDIFVWDKPKDIIGGDFYAGIHSFNKKGEGVEVYIVGDCTGHGIPGAILSVLCNSILREAVLSRNIQTPGQALDFAKSKLTRFWLGSGREMIYDGMDVGICVVNKANGILEFSGANRPLVLVRGEELVVLKGDRQSISFDNRNIEFSTQGLSYEEGDWIYLYSDGIVDQFGGDKQKKFMTKRFKGLLIECNELNASQQEILIKSRLSQWQGNLEQTDDICILGLKL